MKAGEERDDVCLINLYTSLIVPTILFCRGYETVDLSQHFTQFDAIRYVFREYLLAKVKIIKV